VQAAPELLCVPTIGGGGGVPGPEVVVERSYIPSQPYKIAKNGEKTGGFAHILAYKLLKTPFFALKYLTRYTHETFFEEYMNFEGHYLSRCRDISLQSFGSHIRPQPHGLGLKTAQHIYVAKENFYRLPIFVCLNTVASLAEPTHVLRTYILSWEQIVFTRCCLLIIAAGTWCSSGKKL
jgi:hypothetical protein